MGVGGVVVASGGLELVHLLPIVGEVGGEGAAGFGSGSADVGPAGQRCGGVGRRDLRSSDGEFGDQGQHAADQRVGAEVVGCVGEELCEVGCGPIEGTGRSIEGGSGRHGVS